VNLVKNATTATEDGGAVRIRVGLLQEASPVMAAAPSPAAAAGEEADSGALSSTRARSSSQSQPVAPSRYRSAGRNGVRALGKGAGPQGPRTMSLTVDDSGRGMSEEQIARVLNPETGAQRRGMGLRVVRELVEGSGGRLAIESRDGIGTRIEIHWPVVEAEVAEPLAVVSSRSSVLGGSVVAAIEDRPNEAEQRRLTDEMAAGPGKRPVSASSSSERRRSGKDSKGAIAC
jgi:signal transduction histidine kinase